MRNKMLDYQNDEFDYGHNISFDSNEDYPSLDDVNIDICIINNDEYYNNW